MNQTGCEMDLSKDSIERRVVEALPSRREEAGVGFRTVGNVCESMPNLCVGGTTSSISKTAVV